MDQLDRRTILTTGALALAGAAATTQAEAQAGPKSIFPVVGHDHSDRRRDAMSFRCAASTASAATTRRTRARWAPIPTREPPFFFQKPTDAIQNVAIGAVADHPYPSLTKNYHYEVELVAALKSGGTQHPGGAGARPRLWLRASAST